MSWAFITRFGDSSVMLPLAVLAAVGIGLTTRRSAAALACLAPLALAAFLVALSKILFLGFGWGVAALDFTGVSGHAMLAFAIYPTLAHVLARPASRIRVVLLITAYAFATLIAISRVAVGAHSASEVWMGAALGAVASGGSFIALRRAGGVHLSPMWLSPMLAIVLVAQLPSPIPAAHGLLTSVALAVSGHEAVYTRANLHRRALAHESIR